MLSNYFEVFEKNPEPVEQSHTRRKKNKEKFADSSMIYSSLIPSSSYITTMLVYPNTDNHF